MFIGDPSDANGIATNIYADLIQLFGGGTSGTTLTDNLLTGINEDQFAPGGLLAGYTPDDLYPTTIYTIDTDGVADWQQDWNAVLAGGGSPLEAFGNGLYHFFTTHVEYLGLTPEEIASGVATTTGLTTTITIPDGADAGSDHQRRGSAAGRLLPWCCGQRRDHRLISNRRRPFQPRLLLSMSNANP